MKVLITGGSGCIGTALVESFAEIGEVILQYHTNEEQARVLAERTGSRTWRTSLGLRNIKVPEEIDVLVNNAGINESRALTEEVDEDAWDRTLEINLSAAWTITRQCLGGMRRKRWGRIITISSIYGFTAAEGNLPYTVSKHGLRGLTATVAQEYGKYGITANEICPGPVNSPLLKRIAREEVGADGVEEHLNETAADLPLGRLIEAEEVAWTATFLASRKSGAINGVSIPVDGGMTI